MRYLFFFVHPSKFYVFRNTINKLKENGHKVDVLITSKDMLEELVKSEGWEYKNIFPEGRKIKNLSPILSSGINSFRTIYRLYQFTRGKKYNLFITDDLLVYIGKLKKIPSIVFLDDDLSVVKQFSLVLSMADHILSPNITNVGKYKSKKIGFPGYKELAYLHPNHFTPDQKVIETFNPELTSYFIIRLVSLRAYHDVGKKGLSDRQLKKLIQLLENYGNVYLSSERKLPEEFESYRLRINPVDISHVLYYSEMFIGDSQTMSSEASVLGVPTFRCNDYFGKISVMEEKGTNYNLMYNYPPSRFDEMYNQITTFLEKKNRKDIFFERRVKMLNDKIDLSKFMVWLFEKYPESVEIINNDEFSYEYFKMAVK